MDFERRRLPRHLRSPVGELVVCKNWKRGLAVLFLVLEAVSVVLDHVFGNSKWAPLAAFLLSAFGFAITIYACFLGSRRRRKRRRSTIGVIRSQSDRQLEIVDIVFSALQFIATLIHFILMISDVKSNYNASVLLPLAFAIIAVIFVFRTEEIIENSFLEKGLETGQFHFPMLLELESGRCFKSLSGCVKFISETDGGAGWANVEKRYDEITASTNGVLPRARFGECIGMDKDWKEFSVNLFDALTRRHNIHGDTITRDQLREFWDEVNNQSFHSRLQIFFDIVGKNGVDRITEDELTEIICLSASADKFLNTQKKAEEFAAGIMEKLDPYYLGYITIDDLEALLGFASYPPV
ncbi:respiratory burst oxidase homolog protein D-like isoform X1 [Citrus sinensis]|uniref:respiratory burst oxidase homolog protein D-like isoform X1 n=1 Tax=Citrus sinensis TaxID=2711 RepID=UPI0022791308|nr:respiratory burst oxidase homolog protein D-like isoform X1 [Citrus sinensis]